MPFKKRKPKKPRFLIRVKAIRNPKGYKVTDIDRTKLGVTILYKGKRRKR